MVRTPPFCTPAQMSEGNRNALPPPPSSRPPAKVLVAVPSTVRMSPTVNAPTTVELACDTKPTPKVEVAKVEVPVTSRMPAMVSVLPISKVSEAFERRKSVDERPSTVPLSIHVPLYARQPVRRLSPSANVEVAPEAKN